MDSNPPEPNFDYEATLADRKYFFNINDTTFIKRTLRRSEWMYNMTGNLVVPSTTMRYRLENEAACLKYLASTDIPIANLQGIFQDDGAVYLMTKYIDGVSMTHLEQEQKNIVKKELETYRDVLKSLRSKKPGIPGTTFICPQYRVFRDWRKHSVWKVKDDVELEEGEEDFVFCHNDLAQHNVIVDPETLNIKAIIDWEFSGFFPRWFEEAYWEKPGPAYTVGNEDRMREWLLKWCDEVSTALDFRGSEMKLTALLGRNYVALVVAYADEEASG
jgi:aminoglycoside phosphotransferase